MRSQAIRWIAAPAGVFAACLAAAWFYLSFAFPIVFGASLRCLFAGAEPGACVTDSESLTFWLLAAVSGLASGLGSVLLAVLAAPRFRNVVRALSMLVPPIWWLSLGAWNLADPALLVLVATSVFGGFLVK
jgi:hypothetical protein